MSVQIYFTKEERNDFRLFCRQATTTQLHNIITKEEEAGRHLFAEIAKGVLNAREGIEA